MNDEPIIPASDPVSDPVPEVVDAPPICPYCSQNPAQVSSRGPLVLGQLHVMVIYCGNRECSKIWTVEVIGAAQPRIVNPTELRTRPS